jgi:hypothetical protein
VWLRLGCVAQALFARETLELGVEERPFRAASRIQGSLGFSP